MEDDWREQRRPQELLQDKVEMEEEPGALVEHGDMASGGKK